MSTHNGLGVNERFSVITQDMGAKLAHMATDRPMTPGQTLKDRMAEVGASKTQLHEASGVSRNTINSALEDDPRTRPSTYANLLRVLDDIAAERGETVKRYVSSEDAGLITIAMQGVFGVESVTFSGPPEDADVVRQAAVDFVKQVREGLTDDD